MTAPFVYLRLHGPGAPYASGYDDGSLAWWSDRIAVWHEGGSPPDARRIGDLIPPGTGTREVLVYFDNDGGAHAPADALRLLAALRRRGLPTVRVVEDQGSGGPPSSAAD